MKRNRLVVSFAMLFALMVGSLSSVYATTPTTAVTQSQNQIEHMQMLVSDSDGSIMSTTDEWYSPVSGSQRIDEHILRLGVDNPFNRTIIHEGKKYEIRMKNGELRGASTAYKFDKEYQKYGNSLFKFKIDSYKNQWWVANGTVQLNGKQVNKYKNTTLDPKGNGYGIVYIDPSTGLPVKEERYGQDGLWISYTYFFSRVSDPKGELFKDFAGISSFKNKK